MAFLGRFCGFSPVFIKAFYLILLFILSLFRITNRKIRFTLGDTHTMRAFIFSALCSIAILSTSSTLSFAQDQQSSKIDICDSIRNEVINYQKKKVRKSVELGGKSSAGLSEIWSNALYSRVIPLVGLYKDLGCNSGELKDAINASLNSAQ